MIIFALAILMIVAYTNIIPGLCVSVVKITKNSFRLCYPQKILDLTIHFKNTSTYCPLLCCSGAEVKW